MYSVEPKIVPKRPRSRKKASMSSTHSSKRSRSMSKSQTAKVFKDFCESTSFHGYSYLYIANSICVKFIWVIIIILMTALGIGFVLSNTNDYLNARVITTIDTSSAPLEVHKTESSKFDLILTGDLWIVQRTS